MTPSELEEIRASLKAFTDIKIVTIGDGHRAAFARKALEFNAPRHIERLLAEVSRLRKVLSDLADVKSRYSGDEDPEFADNSFLDGVEWGDAVTAKTARAALNGGSDDA